MRVTIGLTLSLRRFFAIFLLTTCAMFAQASNESVALSGLPGVTVVASVITTDSSVVDLPHSTEPGWEPLRQPLGRGFGQQVYWVKLSIDVPPELLSLPMVLRFHPPNARHVLFYLPNGKVISLGTEATFDQRLMGFADLAASFVPTSQSTVVDVRLATAGRVFGTFELMSERAYYQSQARYAALYGVFYGILLLAILVNLLSWVTTRQSIYGLYVGFVGFSLLASLAVNGYLHALVLGAWPQHHSSIQLWSFTGMAATAIAFAARILRLHAWHAWMAQIAGVLVVSLVLLAVLVVFWTDLQAYVWEFVLAAFTVYGLGSLIASARNWYTSPSLQNSLLALAFIVFAASQWVSLGTVFGLLSATPIKVGMWQVGLVVHLVLLQMALVINNRQSRWQSLQQQARLDALKSLADAQARRNRDLQRFLERLTHEFKTPLAVIDSSVQSLNMLEQTPEPERAIRYDRIRRAVTRLNDLLMRSLVAEKTSLERVDSQRQLIELPALLEAALSELTTNEIHCSRNCLIPLDREGQADQIQERRLKLSWTHIDRPDSVLIEADIGLLLTALYHVLDNALKYSIGDETITLEIRKVQAETGSPCVEMWFTNRCDLSLGESDLPKLFEKYYRKGEQGNVPGAGVGLYVAQQVLEQHGGQLTAHLTTSGYIQFRIQLPLVVRDDQP
jgi:signal transduction histidine kinase